MRWWWCLWPAAACAFAAQAEAQRSVSQILAEARQLGVRTGLAATTLDGRFLHRSRSEERFIPASNMKLVTAAGLLQGLGVGFRFQTVFTLSDRLLVCKAGGDPNWIAGSEHAPEKMYRGLVGALQRRGTGSLRGVALDPGCFRGPARPAGWPADQLQNYYCAPTGPFVLEQGTFRLRLGMHKGAVHATLLAPFVTMPIEGTVAGSSNRKAVYGAVDRGDSIQVRGSFYSRSSPVEFQVSVQDTTSWFRKSLVQALEAGGIEVGEHTAAAGGAAGEAVFAWTTPLEPALRRLLLDSSNFDAEQCLRVLGAETAGDGSLAGGVAAAQHELRSLLGSAPEGLQMVDGSGLSRDNRTSPALIAEVLRRSLRTDGGGMLLRCLPLAGESGTLSKRFLQSRLRGQVRAKTGWIRGASALSGVVTRSGNPAFVFSILMNYDPGKAGLNKRLKQLQEELVEALARG